MSDFAAPLGPPPPLRRRVKRPRSRPEKLDDTITRLTEGDDFQAMLKNLSAEEQALFWVQVAELRSTGELDLEDLWKIDYHREPPTMEQFISDDYWLGSWCRQPEDGSDGGLFPAWRDVLITDFDRDSRIHNAVVTGSLGIGKTVISVLIMLYRIAIARCMRNPQSFLGLAKGSAILFTLMSVTRSQVADTAWSDALNLMANSPFFMEECRFSPGKKYANLRVPLGNQMFISAGSKSQHLLGRNTMGVLLDEGNWRLEANPDQKAYELYNEMRTRIANRFRKMSGYLPALSILASSARDESSFTETIINEIRQATPETERVFRFAFYRIKKHVLRSGQRWFRVEYGIKNQDPRILSGWFDADSQPLPKEKAPVEPPTDGASTEFIPEDFADVFKRNVKTALQSICGIATGGSHRLFTSLEIIDKAIQRGVSAGLSDPCKLPLVSLSDENNLDLWEFLDHKKFLTRRAGQIVPLRDPDAFRYVHLDLATTSVAGLAICHATGTKLIEGLYDKQTGNTFAQYRRTVAYDFLLAITAGQNKPISIKKIQDFLFWLQDYCSFRYGKITCDSYGAGLPIQPFTARDIPTDILSLDRNKVPYYSWRSGFEEHRILLFGHPLLLQEAEYLTDHPLGKIDHPEKTPYGPGSKDLTDAAAGAYFNCINDESKSAGNVSPSDVALHPNQIETAASPPIMTVIPAATKGAEARVYYG